jgi:hypothetical protein
VQLAAKMFSPKNAQASNNYYDQNEALKSIGLPNNSATKSIKLPDLIEGGIRIEGPPDTASNLKPPASI